MRRLLRETSLVATCLAALAVAACAPAAAPRQPVEAAKPAASAKPTEAPAAKPSEKSAAGPADSEFRKILDGAKQETNLVVWVTTPNLESTQRAVIDAFKQRFGLNQLQVDWVPLHQRDASLRIRTEAQSGRYSVDVMSASLAEMKPVVEADLVAKVDWEGIFGREFPGIKEPAERMVGDYLNLGLVHWDVAYVMSYNTNQLKENEVPEKLEDLADPKWSGRFALNAAGAAPFDMMALDWGQDKSLEVMGQLIANRPLFKNGTPAVIVAVGQGEAAVGVGQITGTQTEKIKGAPIAWKPMPYVPVLPLYLYVPKHAPSPNAARLFTAWAVTEGMKIQEEQEYIGRVTDPNSFLAREINRMAPNAEIVQEKNLKDASLRQETSEAIAKLRTGT